MPSPGIRILFGAASSLPIHNEWVPFTLAHTAAALPFRRFRLVTSALVVGTFAPDFEYFLWMAPRNGFGHSFPGVFMLTLPLGLAVLWLLHACVKRPAVRLMPEGLRRRLEGYLPPFRWFGAARLLAIVGSLLLGVATHLVWDWFTHRGSWLYGRWGFLRSETPLPGLGRVPVYELLQHGSTVVGVTVLAVWCVHWYRTTKPRRDWAEQPLTLSRRLAAVLLILAVAMVGTAVRVIAFRGAPLHTGTLEGFVGQAVCAFIALVWWELVAYGAFGSIGRSFANQTGMA